ncbi:MAG: Kelch repeat-containing protein [Gemmatimonadales bacterium]
MRYSHTPRIVFAMLGLVLAACNEDATQPSTTEISDQSALAVTATAGQWVTRADMPSGTRRDLATAIVANSAGQSILYAMGGKTPTGSSLSRLLAYNVATNSWSWKNPMPTPFYLSNGAGVISKKIYISGGISNTHGLNLGFFVYNPATNAWAQKADPPGTSYGGVTGVINNKLYVATYCTSDDCEGPIGYFLWRYDPATDQWATLATPPEGVRATSTGGTIGGKLYVVRGDKIGVYDPASDQWTVKTTGTDVGMPPAATLGAKLYAFGPSATYAYDPATNAWTKLAAIPDYRAGMAASRVALNGRARVEVVGGPRPGNNKAFIP